MLAIEAHSSRWPRFFFLECCKFIVSPSSYNNTCAYKRGWLAYLVVAAGQGTPRRPRREGWPWPGREALSPHRRQRAGVGVERWRGWPETQYSPSYPNPRRRCACLRVRSPVQSAQLVGAGGKWALMGRPSSVATFFTFPYFLFSFTFFFFKKMIQISKNVQDS